MRLAILSLLPTLLLAEIIETSHISEVVPLIDARTWLVLDIDNTTYEAKEALGSSKWYDDQLHKKMRLGISRKAAKLAIDPLWFKIQAMCTVKPLENDFVPVIENLQSNKIVVLALTHRQPELANITLRQVASIGLNFSKTAPSDQTLNFVVHNPVLYKDGIIFAYGNSKGKTFLTYLKKIGIRPKKVVFVDDMIENVKDMDAALKAAGIDIFSVHYTAKEFVPLVYSPDIASFQEKFLYQLLSNDAARLLMKNQME